jgi:hypothetical protein
VWHYRRGLDGWYDLLTTYTYELVSTRNYSATANLHNSHITTALAKLFQPAVSSLAVLWQRPLTVEILQLHSLKFSLYRLPYRTVYCLSNDFALACNISARTAQKHPFPLLQTNCCIVKNLLPSSGNVFAEPFPRNGSGISVHLAVTLYQPLYTPQ